ncbi:MAG TPA: S8 family peptidase, partial [Thermoanaerobaculia bacterium]|nr:S8 family peptidase [Thermoanaerobaculia bacterium]
DRTVIAIPLLDEFRAERDAAEAARKKRRRAPEARLYDVIIDLNLDYPGGREEAKKTVRDWIQKAIDGVGTRPGQGVHQVKSEITNQYLFARLERRVVEELVRINHGEGQPEKAPRRALFRVWPDFKVGPLLTRSLATVKADAARVSFSAQGKDILWAVLDSGIQKEHPHFQKHGNLDLPAPLKHRDFTALDESSEQPLVDRFGHGTHVAGIVAGELTGQVRTVTRHRDEQGEVSYQTSELDAISGVAPLCKLLSLKVLDDDGNGLASNLIAAIALIQEANGHGRRIVVHGVNMSVGYDFEPEWFACGQSPLCVEVDRLVRSGVAVVVAAGNTGYGFAQSAFRGTVAAGMNLTINDPGNAELAITVGSTHRDSPHIYGVSYFSSKGPTGDGRAKPDLVAPGEKIVSCAAGKPREELREKAADCDYREESGTSMAAPHVSGAIAAFLSIRREFIGQPEKVKAIFMASATDLNRERYFQGRGLVDLMRAIQSV